MVAPSIYPLILNLELEIERTKTLLPQLTPKLQSWRKSRASCTLCAVFSFETNVDILSSGIKHEDTPNTSDQATGASDLQSSSGPTSGLTPGKTGNTSVTGEGSHLAAATHADNLASRNTSGLPTQDTLTGKLEDTQDTGPSSATIGPHSSNLATKADPRVDSDVDSSRTLGNTGAVGNPTSTGYGSHTSGAFPSETFTSPTATGTGYGNTGGNTSSTGTDYGSSTTKPTSAGAGYDSTTTGQQSSHLGRDAAFGAGGIGLAEQ